MAKQKGSRVPQIRFSSFTDEWDEMALSELLSFKNGYNAGSEQYGAGQKFINVLDIIENDFITHDQIIGKVKIPAKDFGTYEVKFGDILFQRSSETREEVGQANVYLDLRQTAAFGGFIIRGRPLVEFDPEFFNYMLKTAKPRKEITSRSGGSTRYNIGQDSLSDAHVYIAPSILEQRKIANFLRPIEQLVRLHQRKHDKLVTLKQAMLQKMFPQEGASIPEIRFNGFSGDWKEEKLGDICEIVGGGTPSTSIQEYWNGDIDWYSPTEVGSRVYACGSVKKITKLGLNKCSAKISPANKTVLFTSRAGIGDMAILKKAGCTNQGFQSLILHDDIDTYFLYSMGYLIKKYALKNASGSTFLEISSKQLEKMDILLPKESEQQKIGTYFRKLDALITQHATQLEKLKQIKSACLEKMFV